MPQPHVLAAQCRSGGPQVALQLSPALKFSPQKKEPTEDGSERLQDATHSAIRCPRAISTTRVFNM